MNFNIVPTTFFEKELKQLAKKYPSIKHDIKLLADVLLSNPKTGTSLGNNCYKIRMPIASKGKGKSGGARIITHVYVNGKIIYLLSIYDKSETETISDKELQNRLNSLNM